MSHEMDSVSPRNIIIAKIKIVTILKFSKFKMYKLFLMTGEDGLVSPKGPMTPSCSEKLLLSCAAVINAHFRPYQQVHPNQILAGSGCSLLLEAVARVICNPGDVILTPGPIWPVFSTLFAKAEVSLSVILPTTAVNQEGKIPAVDALLEIESLLTWTEETQRIWERRIAELIAEEKTPRAVLISNPQNPLGRCYSRSFLVQALEFCEKVCSYFLTNEEFLD